MADANVDRDNHNKLPETNPAEVAHEIGKDPSAQAQTLPTLQKDSVWIRLTCLLLLCTQNCTATLAIKFNSRLASPDGLKSLSTVIITLVGEMI